MLSNFHSFIRREQFLIGSSLLRISIGLILLYNYLIHYNQRYFLWSDIGVNIYESSGPISLYNFSSNVLYFDLIYHVGIIVSFIYLVGYRGRIFTLLNYIFYYSLYVRMHHISDGGDNLLIICMFFLIFANNTAYFSLDSKRYKNSVDDQRKESIQYQLLSVFHNYAIIFCIIQLCILYFFSGLYQVMGELWQNGTSIYYISQVDEFSRPLLRYIVDNFLWATVIMAYASIFIKLAFPFVILSKAIKPFIVVSMVLFHIGIGLGMGLLTFSLIMIVMELLIFTDNEYRKYYGNFNMLIKRMHITFKKRSRRLGYRYFQSQKVIIFYDGWCGICQNIIRNLKKIDYFRLLKCISFRDPSTIDKYKLNAEEVEKRMHSTLLYKQHNNMSKGIESIIQISKRLLPLWPILLLLVLGSKIKIGGLVYDFIAKRRNILPVDQCNNSCEIGSVVKK